MADVRVDKTLNGAMAVVYVDSKICGIYDSCNYSVSHGTEAVHILGRFSPVEIAITSQEAVSVNCSGFRLVGNGVHVLPKAPKLEQLIALENITISIKDRVSLQNIMIVTGCKVTGHSGGVSSKAISRCSVNYLGTVYSDEEGAQQESAGATDLP